VTDIDREALRVPDRFEALESEDPDTGRVVVVPVEASLSVVDETVPRYGDGRLGTGSNPARQRRFAPLLAGHHHNRAPDHLSK